MVDELVTNGKFIFVCTKFEFRSGSKPTMGLDL